MLLIRVSVYIVMLMWTLDKFFNPSHSAKVYEKFYMISELGSTTCTVIAIIELFVLICFILGVYKRFFYATVLRLHTVSTLSSHQQYMSPFQGANLLFFAAWPICWLLV